MGIRTVLTPVQAPKANAIAERLIRTLRRECLDHLIVIDERHLRLILTEYAAHYDAARPHPHSTSSRRTERLSGPRHNARRLMARPVLGGLHHEYEWMAA